SYLTNIRSICRQRLFESDHSAIELSMAQTSISSTFLATSSKYTKHPNGCVSSRSIPPETIATAFIIAFLGTGEEWWQKSLVRMQSLSRQRSHCTSSEVD